MKRDTAEKFAKNSWRLPLIASFLMIVMAFTVNVGVVIMISVWLCLITYLVGIICGGVACFSVKEHGSKKILAPALIGILLNSFILYSIYASLKRKFGG